MTQITQSRLACRFARGEAIESLPSASNLTAVNADDSADDEYEFVSVDGYLVGHGWAVLAARLSDGTIIRYDGWRGYSVSTSCQLTELQKGFKTALGAAVDSRVIVDHTDRPTVSAAPDSVDLIGSTPAR